MIDQRGEGPAPDEARNALDSISQMTSVGLARGVYPRWFAAATAIWAGAVAALIAFESPIWLILMPAGLLAYHLYRQRQGAWVQEVHSRGEFWTVVIPCAGLLCVTAAAGIIGWQAYRWFWAPIAAGLAIAAGLFMLMERTYAPVRRRLRSEERS